MDRFSVFRTPWGEMLRERLYGLTLAVPACAAIGGEIYPYFYGDRPIWAYDPTVGYWCGAVVGVFPGLFGQRFVIRGHALGAVRGSLTGVILVLAAVLAVNAALELGGGTVSGRNGLRELRYWLLGNLLMPAVTLGGVIGWNRHYDPRPDVDDDT